MINQNDLIKLEKYLPKTKHLDVKEYKKFDQKTKTTQVIREVLLELEDGKMLIGDLNDPNFYLKEKTSLSTISSHFVRGPYGDNKYRGNCTGLIIKELLQYFKPKFVADPMIGSGTSLEVCKELGIPHWGSDLRYGYDALTDEMPCRPDFIWAHPPYYVPSGSYMPKYSGVQWGKEAHPSDGSHLTDFDAFMKWFNTLQARLYENLPKGGRLAFLMGDTRYKGKYYSPVKEMDIYGELEYIIVKEQHQCISDQIKYSGNFIATAHEWLVIIKKNDIFVIPCTLTKHCVTSFKESTKINWKNLIAKYVEFYSGKININELERLLEKHPKGKNNSNIRAKIRQQINTNPQIFSRQGDIISFSSTAA